MSSSFKLTTGQPERQIAAFSILLASALATAWLLDRRAEGAAETGPASSATISAPVFDARQRATQWRAPRLIGVEVDDADGRPVGKVEDLLMTHEGVIQTVVIGVGGFLGLGAKPVAVPFTALQWRMDARPSALVGEGAANPGAGSSSCPVTVEAVQGRPDRVGVTATLAQLQSAPAFAYALSRAAAAGLGSATPGDDAPASPYQ